jgi:hypothetical protein
MRSCAAGGLHARPDFQVAFAPFWNLTGAAYRAKFAEPAFLLQGALAKIICRTSMLRDKKPASE